MPTVFLNSPASDPALTARTFSQNPTLFAALERLKTRGAHGVNTGAEVPGGTDANDPQPLEPTNSVQPLPYTGITFAYRYQVHTVTTDGTPAEIITVAADDMCDAIQKAIAQLVAQHADGIRVVACRELKPRGVA